MNIGIIYVNNKKKNFEFIFSIFKDNILRIIFVKYKRISFIIEKKY